MRLIDADLLKRHIRWDYSPAGGYEEIEKLDQIIDSMQELKNSERDNGAEPILENHTSAWFEDYADGSGAVKNRTTLEWKCPNCGWFVGELYCGHGKWHIQGETSYCASCGQKIDWTIPKDEEKRRYEEEKRKEREEFYQKHGIELDNMGETLRRKHGKLAE